MTWLYLTINLASIAVPFAFSFENRTKFYKKWFALFPALFITAAFFVVWDFWFTAEGIWQFNPKYVLGIYLVNLPIEEWIFFLFIPYCCVFIHESLKHFFPISPFDKYGKTVALILGSICILISLINTQHLYTTVTFLLLGTLLFLNVFVFKVKFLGSFFFTYLVSIIPFCVVNGILTAMPILIYNDAENLGIRIGTIPLEDFFYSMLMLLMNITIFEFLLARRIKNGISNFK